MIRTRVGYAGGRKANPTYHSMGDHSESVELDFDPAVISYEALLTIFWGSHNPTAKPFSRQYMSAVLVRDKHQMAAALAARDRHEERKGQKVYTDIRPFERFYWAEDYHQKYSLRNTPELMREFSAMYPTLEGFVNSTAASRANGFVCGYGSFDLLEQEIELYGLSESAQVELRAITGRYQRHR